MVNYQAKQKKKVTSRKNIGIHAVSKKTSIKVRTITHFLEDENNSKFLNGDAPYAIAAYFPKYEGSFAGEFNQEEFRLDCVRFLKHEALGKLNTFVERLREHNKESNKVANRGMHFPYYDSFCRSLINDTNRFKNWYGSVKENLHGIETVSAYLNRYKNHKILAANICIDFATHYKGNHYVKTAEYKKIPTPEEKRFNSHIHSQRAKSWLCTKIGIEVSALSKALKQPKDLLNSISSSSHNGSVDATLINSIRENEKKKVEIYQRNAKYFLKVLNSLVKAIEPNWVDVQ